MLGVSAGIGVLAYAANTFGAQWVDAGILAAMTAVLLAAGVWAFNRRDLT